MCNKCSLAIQNCETCKPDGASCITCSDGFYLDGIICSKCEEKNKIIQGKFCVECSKVLSGCLTCHISNNKPVCSLCDVGVYKIDSDSDGIYDMCDKCDDPSTKLVKKDISGESEII